MVTTCPAGDAKHRVSTLHTICAPVGIITNKNRVSFSALVGVVTDEIYFLALVGVITDKNYFAVLK